MLEPRAYLNGRWLPQSAAALPLHEAGFVLGATVTDLCRTFRHHLCRLDDHLARFRRSCELARIPQPVPDAELWSIAERLTGENAGLLGPGQDLGLVMFATPGPIGWYAGLPGGPGAGPPTLGMHTFPLPFDRYLAHFFRGVHLVVSRVRHVPPSCVDPRIKQRSRLHWWLAQQEVHWRWQQEGPVADPVPLLLDESGNVTETASANLLIVQHDRVLTPPRCSVLDGISLLTVEELCRELAMPFEERTLSVADCLAADEAMLCCTTYCLAPVSRINGQPIPFPGPVFERLLAAWSQRAGVDIRGQILTGGQ